MKDQVKISNRHLQPLDGLADQSHARKICVSIRAASQWVSTAAGQHLLVCLINLLCRQTDLIENIEVVSDEYPLKVVCPGDLRQDQLLQSLRALVTWAVGDEVDIRFPATPTEADLTINIGCPDQMAFDSPSATLFVIASGWLAWIGIDEHAPRSIVPAKEDPLGPFLAACIAAGEVFKRARQAIKGLPIRAAGYSLWSRQASESWAELEDGPALRGRTLPPLHVFGTGAVGHAFIYTLTASGLGDSYFVLVDDDRHDETNLNRCMLAGKCHVTHLKVNVVEDHVKRTGGGATSFASTVQQYLEAPKPGLRQDVADAVQGYRFDVVASCVDKNISRQSIQGLGPALTVGGSTLGLTARSNVYKVEAGTACLACHNPAEPEGEKIRALEAQLRVMPPDERRKFLLANDLPVDSIEAYLATPTCGSVGEAELREFAQKGTPQFSVGFVSMAAGVLMATSLLKVCVFSQSNECTLNMTAFSFWNGGFLPSALSIDEGCQLRCSEVRSR